MKIKPRSWGTWTAARPVELSHLPSGFCITPVIYSNRANHPSAIPAGDLLRFGRRTLNDGVICFDTTHEDTQLKWQYTQPDPSTLDIHWHCCSHGEWGLRYWINLCFSAPTGVGFEFDRVQARLRSNNPSGLSLSAQAEKPPLMVSFHQDLGALLDEYSEKGYFYLGSRGTSGDFAVLRFNLEEAPALTCRIKLQPSDAANTATDTLPRARKHSPLTDNATISNSHIEHVDESAQGALDAIHDVVAWNHVFDPINDREYTVLTRFWNQQKFGGFGIWMNDVMYHALLWSQFDCQKARSNIDAVFDGQTEQGNFPCLITGNDAWLDRSQPPIVSYVIWCCYIASGEKTLLQESYAALRANYDWWWRRRSLHDTGLVAYGTSLDIGDGLYKGTKLAAKDESSMDNMAVHDEAEFDTRTGLLQAADVGLNSLLALDGEILAQIAQHLDLHDDAHHLEQQVSAHKARIAHWLWDESRDTFANRLIDGRFVKPLAPTSFFPMVAGIATEAQVDSLITHYLAPEHKFGGRFVLPSATRDDPAYKDNVYWRGRIWAPLNYWVYEGLRRYGRKREAQELAKKSFELFNQGWRNRQCGENYHAESGEISDQADTDAFYTWGALLPALTIKEVIDDTPWQGLCLSPSQAGRQFGPVNCALGSVSIRNEASRWFIDRDGLTILAGTLTGRLGKVQWNLDNFSADIESSEESAELQFIGCSLSSAILNLKELSIIEDTVYLPAQKQGGRLQVDF